MAKKLYGTDPDQVPTNADLGTMAYQDKDNFNLGGANNSESKLVMGKFTDRDVLYQYGDNIPTLIIQNDDYSSNDGVGIIMDSNQRVGFYTENGDAHLRTWIKHPVNATYGHFIYQVAVDLDDPENNGTEVFRIKGSGDILPQGNVVMTNGAGIDFSATGNGSGTMTSELLDDYEEGTWGPIITFGGGTTGITYAQNDGWYTRIGRLVVAGWEIVLTNKGSSTGSADVRNFPYNIAATQRQTCSTHYFQFMSSSFPSGHKTFYGTPNSTIGGAPQYFTGSSGTSSSLNNGHFGNSSYWYGVYTYYTN